MSTRTAPRRKTRVHPRMEARRASVRRRRARRRLQAAVLFLGLFTLAGLGWLVVQSTLLDVDAIAVEGAQHTRARDIRKVAGVERGEPLLLVNRGGVGRRVEALPWVADADVTWSLPGKLVVEVEERRAAAWVNLGPPEKPGPVALVDREGRVLEVRDAPSQPLLELRAEVEVPKPGEFLEGADDLVLALATVPEGVRPRVHLITSDGEGGVQLVLDRVAVARLGDTSELGRKWAALEAVLTQLGERSVHLVDVRVPSVPAVRAAESPPPDPAPDDPAPDDPAPDDPAPDDPAPDDEAGAT